MDATTKQEELNYCASCLTTEDSFVCNQKLVKLFEDVIGRELFALIPNSVPLMFCKNCVSFINDFERFRNRSHASIQTLINLQTNLIEDDCELGLVARVSENVKHADKEQSIEDIETQNFVTTSTTVALKPVSKSRRPNSIKPIKEQKTSKPKLNLRKYCDICSCNLKTTLTSHFLNVHCDDIPDKGYKCKICDTLIKRKTVGVHFERHQRLKSPIHCTKCDQTFESKSALRIHMNRHRVYECHHCGSKLTRRASMIIHIMSVHFKVKACYMCRELFTDVNEYKKHLEMERLARKKVICDICGIEVTGHPALASHKKSRHPPKEIVCTLCGQTCSNEQRYKWHYRTKHAEKKHKCEYCGKSFSMPHLLDYHIKSSHLVNPTQCDICGKIFTRSKTMKQHKKIIHGNNYSLTCQVCGRGFKTHSSLIKHKYSHVGKRPFNCHLCPTGYYMLEYLKGHYQRSHALQYSNQEVKDNCIRVKITDEELEAATKTTD